MPPQILKNYVDILLNSATRAVVITPFEGLGEDDNFLFNKGWEVDRVKSEYFSERSGQDVYVLKKVDKL